MERRTAGSVLLFVAVCALMVTSVLIRPGLAGQPLASTLPAPPSVGGCLTVEDGRQVEVRCSTAHSAEITRSWAAWDPAVAGKDRNAMRASCRQAGSDYLGINDMASASNARRYLQAPDLGPDWAPPALSVGTSFVGGPQSSTDPIGFRACVVRVPSPSGLQPPNPSIELSAPIKALIPLTGRPDSLRSCYADSPTQFRSCDQPHRAEVLARSIVLLAEGSSESDVVSDDARLASCTDLAARLSGAPDPTFNRRIGVVIMAQLSSPGLTEQSGRLVSQRAATLSCVAAVTGDDLLTGSIVGLGGAALPIG